MTSFYRSMVILFYKISYLFILGAKLLIMDIYWMVNRKMAKQKIKAHNHNRPIKIYHYLLNLKTYKRMFRKNLKSQKPNQILQNLIRNLLIMNSCKSIMTDCIVVTWQLLSWNLSIKIFRILMIVLLYFKTLKKW